jgi:hypothetical protein
VKRKQAEWDFGEGPYRTLGKQPKGKPLSLRPWNVQYPPEPLSLSVEHVIEEVHKTVARTGYTKVHVVLLHPRDYHELLDHMSSHYYHQMPDYSSSETFKEGQIPSANLQLPTLRKMTLQTGIGPVEVKMDIKVQPGTVMVVE